MWDTCLVGVGGGVLTLTERSKTPALSSETLAGSLMTPAALQFWNQLRDERKTRVLEKTRHSFRTNMGGMKSADFV